MGLGVIGFIGALIWFFVAVIGSSIRSQSPNKAEVFAVIALIAILAFLCRPVFSSMSEKGRQAKDTMSARDLALALRLYASDNNGIYPSYTLRNGQPTTTPVSNSNAAFAQLFPTYVQQEAIFWEPKSAFCTLNPPDEVMDNPPLDTPVNTLKAGENEWAYVLGLNDKSDHSFPLMADGFANPVSHTWSNDQTQKGGIWKGKVAIVILTDSSGTVMPVDQTTMTVIGPNGGAAPGDIFTTAHSVNGWLTTENAVVNPK